MDDQLDEPLTALLQTLVTPSARTLFRAEARRRHVTPSALLRILVMEMLESQEVES